MDFQIIFYGCARKHRLKTRYDQVVITNDIESKFNCNITDDIRNLIRSGYLFNFNALIFTPPCNYYSHANWRRESSQIALETKDLLPLCLEFAVNSGLPFIVENVLNKTFFKDLFPQFQFTCGGHTYWSNVLNISDFKDVEFIKQNKQFVSREHRDNNYNVNIVLTKFLEKIQFSNQEK